MDWNNNPLESLEPVKVARRVLRDYFTGSTGHQGLYRWRGEFWYWDGDQWKILREDEIREKSLLILEDAVWEQMTANGPVIRRYAPDKNKIEGVVVALEALCRLNKEQAPCWIVPQTNPIDPMHCIAFKDCIVDVKNSDTDDWATVPRDQRWFDTSVVPHSVNIDAECPRWMKALDEWGGGDPEWARLLQQWFGYCLMGTRKYAKWLLMYGKIRGGKGTICNVLKQLTGPTTYLSTSLEDLANEFGLDGMELSKVLSISEVSEIDSKSGERVCRILKNIVGRDPMTVNVKYRRQLRNVVVGAAPLMQSNEIPVLPNKGRGLSGKMLVLPFDVSFEGREDFDLDADLAKEIPGIAAWAVRGAIELEASSRDDKWPTPAAAKNAIRLYHLQNNPFDSFLEARFIRNEKGFTANEIVRGQWESWLRANKVKMHVPRNMLIQRVVQDCSWDLRQTRLSMNEGHHRGVSGMTLKREYDDEH